MRIPCEVVVRQILPSIRREMARDLVEVHGLTQADVARLFGVTDAAISQYLRRKRGASATLESSPGYPKFREYLSEASRKLATGTSDFATEMCGICLMSKRLGVLAAVYREEVGVDPPDCAMADSINLP